MTRNQNVKQQEHFGNKHPLVNPELQFLCFRVDPWLTFMALFI
jgi:hypothetical protein